MLSILADSSNVFPDDVRWFIIAACVALFIAAIAGFAIALFTWWTAHEARRQHTAEMADVRNQQRAIFAKLDAQALTFQNHANEVMRALGRLEKSDSTD